MPLAPGTSIGPYEIVSPLGAGGMGEVYRARDPRINRDVAIKILPADFAKNEDRLRRFEREARSIGGLNHPSLMVVHDVGTHEGTPYIVSELLEGETLRGRLLRGSVPQRKVIDWTVQLAEGLAAAHRNEIIHRDLKPENIFVTEEERIKILDFGLAKLLSDEGESADAPTRLRETAPGAILGTPAYMAPEQLRGEPSDARTDVFALGIVLAEMLSGFHPFQKTSLAETSSAILVGDAQLGEGIPPAIRQLVDHLLEKAPINRFQSMKDVALSLRMISTTSDSLSVNDVATPSRGTPKFKQITFRRGHVMTARFTSDGSVVYGAAWEDRPVEIFTTIPGSPESRHMNAGHADVHATSDRGDLLISLGREYEVGWSAMGTLARLPLAGGTPRRILEKVQDAEWMADGKNVAVIHQPGALWTIEVPIGNVVCSSELWISDLRLSPDNSLVAFVEHQLWGDDGGRVVIIAAGDGARRNESSVYASITGLAWSPGGDEVLFAGQAPADKRDLWGLSIRGEERHVYEHPGRLSLHDIDRSGRLLLSTEHARREILFGSRGDQELRNLSWFDWSFPGGLSEDGREIVIEEQGFACAENMLIYLRPTDGSPAFNLGEGRGRSISPDGKWVGMLPAPGSRTFDILPTGPGVAKTLVAGFHDETMWCYWSPTGQSMLIWGKKEGSGRIYEIPTDGSEGKAWAPGGVGWPLAIAPEGDRIAAPGPDGRANIFRRDREQPEPIEGSRPGDRVVQWSGDGQSIWVHQRGRYSVMIERIDLAQGTREEWRELRPNEPAGVIDIMPVFMTRDGEKFAFGYRRCLSDLFVVEGLL